MKCSKYGFANKEDFIETWSTRIRHIRQRAQNTSCEYGKFSDEWNFQHHTSSPHYPKGNGTAEVAVKQAKRILKMSKDPWLAILEQRNTPDELASPNEKLMSRRTRATLSI